MNMQSVFPEKIPDFDMGPQVLTLYVLNFAEGI